MMSLILQVPSPTSRGIKLQASRHGKWVLYSELSAVLRDLPSRRCKCSVGDTSGAKYLRQGMVNPCTIFVVVVDTGSQKTSQLETGWLETHYVAKAGLYLLTVVHPPPPAWKTSVCLPHALPMQQGTFIPRSTEVTGNETAHGVSSNHRKSKSSPHETGLEYTRKN